MPIVVGRDAASGIPTDRFVFFSINHASYAAGLESWDGTSKSRPEFDTQFCIYNVLILWNIQILVSTVDKVVSTRVVTRQCSSEDKARCGYLPNSRR